MGTAFKTTATFFILLASAISGQAQTADASSQADSELVHYGDVIEIDVVGSTEYDWRGSVTPEGFLGGYDAPIDSVFALCKSPGEIASELAAALGRFLRNPKVDVRIIDRSSRPLVVLTGAVRTPQRFQIKRAVTLRELIVLAGGMTEQASGEIQIYRPSRIGCTARRQAADGSRSGIGSLMPGDFQDISVADLIAGKSGTDPLVASGDVITVLEALPIYVIGGVSNPRQISTRTELTVSRAIAMAGGLLKNADASKVRIFRRKTSEGSVIDIDLQKIKAGSAKDVSLLPYDVVEVGETGRERNASRPFIRFDQEAGRNPQGLPLKVIE